MPIGKKMTTEEFITLAKNVHGDKYDYSKVEYVSSDKKVCIICPKHGEFWQVPNSHLQGRGCPVCGAETRRESRTKTTYDFITKAREIHGDKYDYSKVEYKGANVDVCIICPEHGEFWQRPTNHLTGKGCPKCAGRTTLTREDFIAKAREVHGSNKYDYSKVEYVNAKTKVCIICPEHGEFWQLPDHHLKGAECPKCHGRGKTTEEFITELRDVHGDKYDYSKVEYVKNSVKVCVICPEHGEFFATPANLLKGRGCPKCAQLKRGATQRLSKNDFITKAREIHGDKYDYSKVKYVNSITNVCIICPEHGEFWQRPNVHLRGAGCPKCVGKNGTTEEFIAKAKEVHGNKYDYSKVVYEYATKKVCIICPEHGEFWQTPSDHLLGRGCPNCHYLLRDYKFNLLQEFETEFEFRAFLENNDINILQVILRNVEPKYEPLKRDIERALANSDDVNPIDYLEQKYSTESEEDENEGENEIVDNEPTIENVINNVDLDDDDAVTSVLTLVDESKKPEETTVAEPTIEQVIENTNKELKVINRIEHMLTPEDREYIMDKFLNDKRREWMAKRAV